MPMGTDSCCFDERYMSNVMIFFAPEATFVLSDRNRCVFPFGAMVAMRASGVEDSTNESLSTTT